MEQGLQLMAVGMGTVFAFLALMVLVMNIAARVFARFGGPDEPPPRRAAAAATALPGEERDIAVVLAAVEAWRRRNASGGN